eukprot:12424388-Karenia_brevis.AAC.1
MMEVFDVQKSYLATCSDIRQHFQSKLLPQDALVAGDEEIRNEALRWCAQKKNSWKFNDQVRQYYLSGGSDFSFLLNKNEKTYVDGYRMLWDNERARDFDGKNAFFNLQDNPAARPCMTLRSCKLPTYRRGTQKVWADWAHRWMTPKERLCSMGFPVYPWAAAACGSEVLDPDSQEAGVMVGNAMCMPNSAVVLAVAASCFRQVKT